MSIYQIRSAYRDMLFEQFIIQEHILTEDRIDFIKKNLEGKKISTEHDPMAQHQTNDDIVDHMAANDPTPKKLYTQWMVGQYRKGGFKQEDAYRVGDNLKKFHANKNALEIKDINKHTPASLRDATAGLASDEPKSENALNKEAIIKGHTKVFGDDKIDIFRLENTPEGKKASMQLYGGGSTIGGTHTDWCTADRRDQHNMFDHYSKDSNLHVIHRKADDAVFQYHTSSNQFMNAKDETISKEDFESIKPSLHAAWDKHPELLK